MMRLVALSLLASGCAPAVVQSADAARADAFVSRDCTWSDPPTAGVCDEGGRQECDDWAAATTQSSALIAFSACDMGLCMAAHDCSSAGCTCGGQAACAPGSICAVRSGEITPSCIACVR